MNLLKCRLPMYKWKLNLIDDYVNINVIHSNVLMTIKSIEFTHCYDVSSNNWYAQYYKH
jgi:hypothetical protein